MQLTKIFSVCSILSLAAADVAPKATKNPKRVVAVADFPEKGVNKFTKGYVFFSSPTGSEVKVHIDFTGLPKAGGPFYYHIHEGRANSDACDDVGGHFDPYKGLTECPLVGDDGACQVGDLTGKHGWINTTCFQTEYFDSYLSLDAKDPAYVVGRSLVIHQADLTRFACANINIATKEQYKQLFGTDDAFDDSVEGPTPADLEPVLPVLAAPGLQPESAMKYKSGKSSTEGESRDSVILLGNSTVPVISWAIRVLDSPIYSLLVFLLPMGALFVS